MRNLIKKSEKKEQPRRTYNWECKANGCTLPATRVTEWHDNLHGARGDLRDGSPKGGCCSYHASNKMHNWDRITHRIKKLMPVISVVGELDQLSTVQLADCIPTEIDGYPATKPLQDETIFQWIKRMTAKIDTYILADLPDDVKQTTRTKADIGQMIRNALNTQSTV